MNRVQLRQLAEDRILDAACLLAGDRWAGAYYVAGYAAECGLKACIMAHVEAIGAIFQDRKFSQVPSCVAFKATSYSARFGLTSTRWA
jgi:hypothetical protein